MVDREKGPTLNHCDFNENRRVLQGQSNRLAMAKNHDEVWENCKELIRKAIGDQEFNTWFSTIRPLSLEGNVLTIQVPSQYFYEWLEDHYAQILRQALDQELGKDGMLQYSVIVDSGSGEHAAQSMSLPSQNPPQHYQQKDAKQSAETWEKYNPFRPAPVSRFSFEPQLTPQYTFHNFIEGECNRLARSAGIAVSNHPGTSSFNPLMIYGGVGLGKTHLVQAIGNSIHGSKPDKFIIYVPADKFKDQFIEAVTNNQSSQFTQYYSQVDVLILEDVQFLAGKERTQDIFFHIFNHLHQSGKQIIMTSDSPPVELKGLHERLLTRFRWGLTADLQPPDYETRLAIIKKKMEQEGLKIPYEVMDYLAQRIQSSVRELEGVLIGLVAQNSFNDRELSIELARQIMRDIVADTESAVLNVDQIQQMVADYFHIGVEQLKDKTRKSEIVLARHIAMYFAKEYTDYSLSNIGNSFGGRDHTTVLHGIRKVNEQLTVNQKFKKSFEELEERLRNKYKK